MQILLTYVGARRTYLHYVGILVPFVVQINHKYIVQSNKAVHTLYVTVISDING